MPEYIDLSHTIEDGVSSYKGLPGPVICDFWSREYSKQFYEEGTSFLIGKIEMVGNTGTYLDTPYHRFENGKDLSQILIEQTTHLEGIVIHVPFNKSISINASFFQNLDLENKAVLVHTGWDIYYGQEKYYSNNPFLTEDAAEFLVSKKVKLVGIDSHNIDDTSGKTRPVHTTLLKNEILIVEHLCNLSSIPHQKFYFTATPPKVKGFGTFPVRAFAEI